PHQHATTRKGDRWRIGYRLRSWQGHPTHVETESAVVCRILPNSPRGWNMHHSHFRQEWEALFDIDRGCHPCGVNRMCIAYPGCSLVTLARPGANGCEPFGFGREHAESVLLDSQHAGKEEWLLRSDGTNPLRAAVATACGHACSRK